MCSAEPVSIDFREPANLEELAVFIGIEKRLFEKVVLSDQKSKLFYRYEIPKRSKRRLGERRVVWEAHGLLADTYKSFSRRFDLFARYTEPRFPHAKAYGYVRGRGTIDNAIGHCNSPKILHADIENFFPSISKPMLKKTFVKLGMQEDTANILSEFVTIEDTLPLGLHASPLLANLICLDLDDKLQSLAQGYDCAYTRYADDITISGKTYVPDKDEIKNVLGEEGFSLSERKFRITKPGQAHYVTGLSVTDVKPRAPRAMKKKLRQELFYCKKFGVCDHIDRVDKVKDGYHIQRGINRIDGMVRYISNIEKEALPSLRNEWSCLLEDQGLGVNYETIHGRDIRYFNFYVDETEIKHEGKIFLALCFVQMDLEDAEKMTATTDSIHRRHVVSPFTGGDKKALTKKGLHYNDSVEDLRRDYIEHLSASPFRSYLVYGELASYSDYGELYISLIKKILPHRLMSCDQSVVNIIFEENSKVKKVDIEKAVTEINDGLEKTKNRCPSELSIIVGKKLDYLCFSVPDFLLGVFSSYSTSDKLDGKHERKEMFFEQLRDKYRVILDADKSIVFSRKRPFSSWVKDSN